MIPLFTPEELAELAAYDARVEAEPLTNEEIAESRERDRMAIDAERDVKGRKVVEQKRAYRQANREKVAEQQRAYRARKKQERMQRGEDGP